MLYRWHQHKFMTLSFTHPPTAHGANNYRSGDLTLSQLVFITILSIITSIFYTKKWMWLKKNQIWKGVKWKMNFPASFKNFFNILVSCGIFIVPQIYMRMSVSTTSAQDLFLFLKMEKLKELSLCEFYQFKLLILEIKIEKLKMFNIQLFHINHF